MTYINSYVYECKTINTHITNINKYNTHFITTDFLTNKILLLSLMKLCLE